MCEINRLSCHHGGHHTQPSRCKFKHKRTNKNNHLQVFHHGDLFFVPSHSQCNYIFFLLDLALNPSVAPTQSSPCHSLHSSFLFIAGCCIVTLLYHLSVFSSGLFKLLHSSYLPVLIEKLPFPIPHSLPPFLPVSISHQRLITLPKFASLSWSCVMLRHR